MADVMWSPVQYVIDNWEVDSYPDVLDLRYLVVLACAFPVLRYVLDSFVFEGKDFRMLSRMRTHRCESLRAMWGPQCTAYGRQHRATSGNGKQAQSLGLHQTCGMSSASCKTLVCCEGGKPLEQPESMRDAADP